MIVLHEIITHFSYIELIERKTRPNCLIRLWIIFKTLVLIILEMLLVLPALNFFIINMRNLMKATEAMYVVAAFSISAFMYVFLLFDKTALRVVFERMQTIVGKRMADNPNVSYPETEWRVTKETRLLTRSIWSACMAVCMMPVMKCCALFLVGRYSSDSWYLPFKVIMPYNQNATIGFAITLIIQTVAVMKFCAIFCPTNAFFVAVCRYVETFVDDMAITLGSIDELNQQRNKGNNRELIGQMKQRFVEAMEFHMEIVEFGLVAKFNGAISGCIFLTFSIGIVWLCMAIFQFEFQGLSAQLLQSTVANMLILVCLYIYCLFGDIITRRCQEINDIAYSLQFYTHPVKLQPTITLIMAAAQKPHYITGYKITQCSLESFKKLINTTMSFYMVFKKVGE